LGALGVVLSAAGCAGDAALGAVDWAKVSGEQRDTTNTAETSLLNM